MDAQPYEMSDVPSEYNNDTNNSNNDNKYQEKPNENHVVIEGSVNTQSSQSRENSEYSNNNYGSNKSDVNKSSGNKIKDFLNTKKGKFIMIFINKRQS